MEKISGIESIVERQVRRWEKKKRRSQSAESSTIWQALRFPESTVHAVWRLGVLLQLAWFRVLGPGNRECGV